MDLGHQVQNLTLLDQSGTVIQLIVILSPHRQTHCGHQFQIAGGLQDRLESLFRTFQQRVVQKQIAAGISSETQLRQAQHLDPLLIRLPHQSKDLLCVIAAVGHPNFRRTGSYLDKSISHHENLLRGILNREYDTPNPGEKQDRGRKSQDPRSQSFGGPHCINLYFACR